MLAMSQRPRLTGHLSVNSNCHLRDIGARLSSQLEMVKRSPGQVDNDRSYRPSQTNPSVVSTTVRNEPTNEALLAPLARAQRADENQKLSVRNSEEARPKEVREDSEARR